MSIQTNTFCWHSINTTGGNSVDFYTSVLDWSIDESGDQPIISSPGGMLGHMQPTDGPPAWCSFLAVDDIDASTAKSVAAGGMVIVPPTKLPAGAFSVVASPSGAVFGLYEGVEEDDAPKPGPGTIHWVELHSKALSADLAWLEESFGISSRAQQMAMGPYQVLTADGEPRGGAMEAIDTPSMWLAWVQVTDVEATVGKVNASGGSVLRDVFGDPEVGKMAVVADPTGAVFGVVQPNA